MLLDNKRVAIIGGGPVGLTMAVLLRNKGVNVTVYERDESADARIWGGTLDLHKTTGQEALKEAGLLRRYYDMAKPMGRTIADERGDVLFTRKPTPEDRYDAPEINRSDLRKLLLEGLSGDTVAWNRKFTGLEACDGRWLSRFDNAPDEVADLVIAANGGMTKARSYVTDARVEYTGTFIIQGEVAKPELICADFLRLCDGDIVMVAGDGGLLVANPDNNGVLTYNAMFATPAEWATGTALDFEDVASVAAYLSSRFAGWSDCYQRLFQATSFFKGLPTRKISLDKPWKTERPLPITLIGDAAHIMPPFAGQGANIGLVDALILSRNLTNGTHETIEAAISDYERQMFVYATEAQLETSKNEIAMRSPGFSFIKRFEG